MSEPVPVNDNEVSKVLPPAIGHPQPSGKSKKSRKRRLVSGIVQTVVLVAVLVAVFVFVPAINKMAQRKPDAPTPQSQSSTGAVDVTSSAPNTAATKGAQTANGSQQGTPSGSTPGQPTIAPDGGEYALSVYDVQTDAAGVIAVTLDVSNPSKTSLLFDPAKQFKMVGLKSGQQQGPITIPGKTSIAAGELKPGQIIKGDVYIRKSTTEDAELRFFPNLGDPDYIVVPLIPVPVSQQNQ